MWSNQVLVVLHCVPFGGKGAISPVSNSSFINKLGTFLLTSSLWSIVCSMIQLSRTPDVVPETGYTDGVPLILLVIGILINALVTLSWYVFTSTDRWVMKQQRADVVKTWLSQMKAHDGSQVHPDELVSGFAKKLIKRSGLRYALFPEHEKQPPTSLLARMRAHAEVGLEDPNATAGVEVSFDLPSDCFSRGTWVGKYRCRSSSSGQVSAAHVLSLSLHSNKEASGTVLLKGLQDGKVDLIGKWDPKCCKVTVMCQYLFGEVEEYIVVLRPEGSDFTRADEMYSGKLEWIEQLKKT